MTTSSFPAPKTSDDRPAFVPTRLKLREEQIQEIIPSSGASPFGSSFADLLDAAYEKAEIPAPSSPTVSRTCKRSTDKHAIMWAHPLFGSVEVDMGHHEMSEVVTKGPNSCSQVYIFGQPSLVWLKFAVKAVGKVRIVHAKAGQVDDVTNGEVPILKVPVRWVSKDKPHTRERDMDNVDFVLLNEEGMFVQLQVSLVTRKERFWVQIQEIYSGQVVRTNHVKAKQLAALNITTHQVGSHAGLVVPLYAENAYRGADYLKSNARMGWQVVSGAIDLGYVVPMGDAVVAKWQPESLELPAPLADKGFTTATVLWFNLVLGQGFAVLPDGQSCFLHFDNIVDENGSKVAEAGECPMLQPMKTIAVRHNGGDKPKAVAIRVL